MLILVVGPSGAGKDTLLGMAKRSLLADGRFRFVRRVITRPPDPDGEDHESVSEDAFSRRCFALRWQAHGLSYGIPADIAGDLARGIVVIASVSRLVIAEASRRFSVRVIEVTAPPAVLAERLAIRGREGAAEIEGRLSRQATLPDWVSVDTVVNDGSLAEGHSRFTAALLRNG